MIKKLFERRPNQGTEGEKIYLSQYGKDRLDKILKKMPPRTNLSEITGVSISTQAYYNYINYDKPLSRRGVEACEALDKYVAIEEEQVKGITLEIALKVIKQHGGKVTF